jgi:hypothetical protein
LKVDDELEFSRLQHRQVGGLRTFEDVAGIDANLTKCVREVGIGGRLPMYLFMTRNSAMIAAWSFRSVMQAVLACFDPRRPNLKIAVAYFRK